MNGMRTKTKLTRSQMRFPRRQRGVALITVLLVFAIATLISSKIILAKVIDVQRTTGLINRTQAYYYALAAEQLAILALQQNAQEDADNSPQGDHLEEFWAQGPIPFEIDNIGSVLVHIVDHNRYYNLNNLIGSDGNISEHELERFRDLLIELNIDETLADNLADWIDVDSSESGYESESDDYAREQPPYVAANQLLSDVSELRLVSGFTPEVIELLAPHVTVIKRQGILPLNVNTATEYALATLQVAATGANSGGFESIGLTGAQNITSARSEPFATTDVFRTEVQIANLQSASINNKGIARNGSFSLTTYGVISEYFDIYVRANYAGSIAYLSTTVQRDGTGETAKFTVLQRNEADNSARFVSSLSDQRAVSR